jgi:hypothetical protein
MNLRSGSKAFWLARWEEARSVSSAKAAERECVGRVPAGLGRRNLDVRTLLNIFELLQQHYPERLFRLWFLNGERRTGGTWRESTPCVCVFLGGGGGRRFAAMGVSWRMKAASRC